MKTEAPSDSVPVSCERPSFARASRFWLKLGLISFGGPAGQIAVMHTELVERKKWISEERFLHALNFCMLLPGPEAQQLATYVGWLLHRTRGGLVAGMLFVLPSAILLWGLSLLYVLYGQLGWGAALFDGLKPAVLAIVAAAAIRIGGRVLKSGSLWTLAIGAFAVLFFLKVSFPFVILAAGIVGWFGGKIWPAQFHATKSNEPQGTWSGEFSEHLHPSWKRSLRTIVISVILWWAPVILVGSLLGWHHSVTQEGVFFSKAAMVTFGGAYAVLPYVSQQAVEHYQWLSAPQMVDGLGLAETTPGPLIMVLQFVGFLGGWNHPGSLPRLWSATLGAAITTWATFAPCFLWIFLGAPYIEKLRGNRSLNAVMTAITASIAGVIANLAIWFAGHVLFLVGRYDIAGLNVFAAVLTAVAFIGLVKWRWPVVLVIVGAATLGLARFAIMG
jgi:chromate transporter